MDSNEIPTKYLGWWRIVETTQWLNEDLDAIGTALISITGDDDRLRMLYLLARIRCEPIAGGVSFVWQGAWEWDQLSGHGSLTMREDGKLNGTFQIDHGDGSTFVAERTTAPRRPIPNPPRYSDKWKRRR